MSNLYKKGRTSCMVIFAGFLTYHEGTHTYTDKTHFMDIYALQD